MSRKINEAGRALIKAAEGLRLNAYRCPAGVMTIGYGHTGDVKKGQTITSHQADAILDLDLSSFEDMVEALTLGKASDNEFAALVSFAFNLGSRALAGSTLLKKFRAGDRPGTAAEFMRWQYAAGKVLPGLVKRRAAERALFLAP